MSDSAHAASRKFSKALDELTDEMEQQLAHAPLETKVIQAGLANRLADPRLLVDYQLRLMELRLQEAILRELEQLNRDSLLNRAFLVDELKPWLRLAEERIRRIENDVETLRLTS